MTDRNIAMNNTLARMQTLVGQAGEALGITEDPLSSVAGVRVGDIIMTGSGLTLSLRLDSGGHQRRPGH